MEPQVVKALVAEVIRNEEGILEAQVRVKGTFCGRNVEGWVPCSNLTEIKQGDYVDVTLRGVTPTSVMRLHASMATPLMAPASA